jgi:hypothetical protein
MNEKELAGRTVGVEWVGDNCRAWEKRDGTWVLLAPDDPLAEEILRNVAPEKQNTGTKPDDG